MTPPRGPADSLPVFATVVGAYRALFLGFPGFARAAFLPFVLSIACSVPLAFLDNMPVTGLLFWLFAVSVPCTLFGVAWYRLLLLGADAAPPALVPAWRARHWRFLSWMLLLLLFLASQVAMLLVVSLVAAGIPKVAVLLGELLVLTLVLVVILRLSLVFPAAAVDQTYPLSQAWRHTRGQSLRLLGAALLGLLPFVLASGLLLPALLPERPAEVQVGMVVVGPDEGQLPAMDLGGLLMRAAGESAVSYLALGLAVAIIAAAFRTCAGWVPASGEPPAPPDAGGRENHGDDA